ncbi:MAG: RICIN domain-containing protein [Oscillospiraceae bacterium]|jgi:hypothetical protein|nr:RICIN domain-containing protein [Oscillospiraceae bacterium]
MGRIKKVGGRIIATVLSLAMFAGLAAVLPIRAEAANKPPAANGNVLQRIEQLRNTFDGGYFTVPGQSCSLASGHSAGWTDSAGKYYAGIAYSSCSNCKLSNIMNNMGYSMPSGMIDAWTCVSFARFAFWYIFGLPYNATGGYSSGAPTGCTKLLDINQAVPGDLVVFTTNGTSGHQGIFLSKGSGNNINIFDCNGGAVTTVSEVKYNRSREFKGGFIIHANNYDTINGSTTTPTLPTTSANIANGKYTIAGLTSGKVLTPTYNVASGNNVFIYPVNYEENGVPVIDKQWELTRLSDNTYKVISVYRNQALDVAGAGTEDGVNVQVANWTDNAAQHWYIVDCGNGWYKFVAKHSGKVLDVANDGTSDFTNIQQVTDTSSNAQRFKLVSVPSPTPGAFTVSVSNPSSLTDDKPVTFTWTISSGAQRYDVFFDGA